MRYIFKPFALVLSLALFLINLIIEAAAWLFSWVAFWIFLLLGICGIIAIVQHMWQELLMLGGIVAVILIVFFGSAALSANINRLRRWLVEF